MTFSFSVQLHAGEDGTEALPPLLFGLLREIERKGNLAAAARQSGVSYRKAWNLVQYWTTELGQPLTEATKGRGAILTEAGKQLLAARDYLDAQGPAALEQVVERVSESLHQVFNPQSGGGMSIAASHCICLDILDSLFSGRTSASLSIECLGSCASLLQLHRGNCRIAGFHIADGGVADAFKAIYSEAIPLSQYAAVRSHRRQQGLIVEPGNPLNLTDLADLQGSTARLVNRQPGSGTRILFDALAAQLEIDVGQIRGYEDIALTHSAVCAKIANSQADVAVGTEASADQFGLGFVPLVAETYYFAFDREAKNDADIAAFNQVLASPAWAHAIEGIPGMSAAGAGVYFASAAEACRL